MSPFRSSAWRQAGTLAACMASGILAACSQERSEPAGQVVASVNGEEITASELRAEADVAGADLRDPAIRARTLQVVIDRHLKAAAATERGLYKDPQFLAHRRRLEQDLLAQLFMRSRAMQAEEPGLHEVRMFILKNPGLFEGKEQLVVDRIGFTPARLVSAAEIDAVKTLADAERLLKEKRARVERRTISIDPADLPTDVGSNLAKLPLGEAFFAAEGETGMFGVIVERKPDPVPVEKQVERARIILKRRGERESVDSGVKALWKGAEIRYQTGYGPGAPKSSAK